MVTNCITSLSGPASLWRADRHGHGFLSERAVELVAVDDQTRLFMLLIRWHEGRALVPACTVADVIAVTERGGWTVRDVSIPAGATIPKEG